ncbi:hypothetical protein HYZ05_00680 [Candidatus Daviesbacteria bacterium]|nr:hypothetical protein [Candidatus Daviesbacteria bacterium]
MELDGGGYSVVDYLFGNTAQIRYAENLSRQQEIDKKYRRKLEQTNTLGSESSVLSFSGWSVRYPVNDGTTYIPTPFTSTPIGNGEQIKLPGNMLNELESTGIFIKDHLRTSDQVPVGRLAIATRYTPAVTTTGNQGRAQFSPERYDFGEEDVLRDPITGGIVVFEKPAGTRRLYLQITRSKSSDTQEPVFYLRQMEPKK